MRPQGARLDVDRPHEILTGPGPGTVFGPHVRGFNHDGGTVGAIAKVSFFAYGTLRYGVNAVGGDVDSDDFEEILTGPGPGDVFGSQLRGFDYDGSTVRSMAKINAIVFAGSTHGLEVASGDTDLDGAAEIACGAGPSPGSDSRVAVYDYYGISGLGEMPGSRFEGFAAAQGGVRLAFGSWADRDVHRELLVSRGPLAGNACDVAVFDDAVAGFAPLAVFNPYPAQAYGVTLGSAFVGF